MGPLAQLAEHRPFKAGVAGSSPARLKFWPVRLSVRTQGFQPCKRSSTLLRAVFLRKSNISEYLSFYNPNSKHS